MPTTNTFIHGGTFSSAHTTEGRLFPEHGGVGSSRRPKVFQQRKRRFLGKKEFLPQGCSIFSPELPASQPAAPPANGSQTCQSLNHYANSFKEPLIFIRLPYWLISFWSSLPDTGQRSFRRALTVQYKQSVMAEHAHPA